MKNIKVLICTLLCVFGIIAYSDVSYAATLQADSELGESVYSIDSQAVWSPTSSTPTRFTATDSIGTWTLNGYKACIYRLGYKTNYIGMQYDYYLYVYNKNGYVEISATALSYYGVTSGTSVSGNRDLTNWTNADENSNFNYLYLEVHFRTYEDIEWSHLITNIPIFETKDMAISFMTNDGTVTEKDSINYEENAPCIYGDLEVPQNIKLNLPSVGITEILSSDDIVLNWEQTDENYLKWDSEVLIYATFQTRMSFLFVPLGGWTQYDEKFIYSDIVECRRLKYILDSDKRFDWICDWLTNNEIYDYAEVEELQFFVFIRNKYFDGNKTHYSNWVKCTVDCNYGWLSTDSAEGILEEIIYDNMYGDENNDFSNSMPSGEINPDSNYNGNDVQVGNATDDSDSIFGFVSSGFGLLGDDGLLGLIKSTFSFVPDELWGVFVSGIGMFVIIAIYKLIRG